MPFIPHTDGDRRDMLAAIGAASIDELFDEIPAALRIGGLDTVPPGLNEAEITGLMQRRAARMAVPPASSARAPTITIFPPPCGTLRPAANFIARTPRTRRKPVRAPCS